MNINITVGYLRASWHVPSCIMNNFERLGCVVLQILRAFHEHILFIYLHFFYFLLLLFTGEYDD